MGICTTGAYSSRGTQVRGLYDVGATASGTGNGSEWDKYKPFTIEPMFSANVGIRFYNPALRLDRVCRGGNLPPADALDVVGKLGDNIHEQFSKISFFDQPFPKSLHYIIETVHGVKPNGQTNC